MAAANTDKLRKKKSLFQTTLNGSISAVDTSLTLNSAAGLPTDTGVTIVINRVDANGNATPSAMEVITGVVSGSTVASLLRGKDSTTAKSHGNASVVEMVWDAATWNDFVDAYLGQHSQDGLHKESAVSVIAHAASSKATPVDADEIPIVDSAASNVLKKLTWANLKATLLTWLQGGLLFPINAPTGFLINGKIVVTVASNNITVALKGADGNDPSATNPVYCKIGGVIRSVTAALSVTKNAGTNWFGSGGSMFATKEMDYFAYLGYNATDGVTIGFSLNPNAAQYSDFSTTNTNDNYCAISTITNAAATDYYNVIGRFAATLSAGAGYTWSVPTFTAINLVQRPIYETRILDYVPTWGNTTIGNATITAKYQRIGKRVKARAKLVWGNTTSTSATPPKTVSLPFVAVAYPGTAGTDIIGNTEFVRPGSTYAIGVATMGSTTVLNMYYIATVSTIIQETNITNTTPITWTTGDEWWVAFEYETSY